LLASFLSPYYGWRYAEKKNRYPQLVQAIILNAIKVRYHLFHARQTPTNPLPSPRPSFARVSFH
jgi:hypothetical protein